MKRAVRWSIVLIVLCMTSPVRGDVEALNPRNKGDWDHTNSPMRTFRQNCHPAMRLCQLPRRAITKKESDLNERSVSGEKLGTPNPPLVSEEDALVGSEIGAQSSLNQGSARSGPAIKQHR